MDNILGCSRLRHSDGINLKPAGNVYPAPRIAEAIGLPLNYLATINFGLTPLDRDDISGAFGRLRANRFNKWAGRPLRAARHLAVPPTFTWVLENEGNHVGVHAHWLVHIPNGRLADFRQRLPVWVARVAGAFAEGLGVIDVRQAETPNRAARYLLKGGRHGVSAFYGARATPQGDVTGKSAAPAKTSADPLRFGCAQRAGIVTPTAGRLHLDRSRPAMRPRDCYIVVRFACRGCPCRGHSRLASWRSGSALMRGNKQP
jgi:hypothetical protein